VGEVTMSDVEDYAKQIIEVGKVAVEFKAKLDKVCKGSFEWGIEELAESYLSIFDRFSPFAVDDRVQLSKTLDIAESSGWYGSRHFLVQGSKATVRSRGYRDNKFSFDVVFDNETYISTIGDTKGQALPVSSKHTYQMLESDLLPLRESI
jgi:hypothetical protein